MLTLKDLEDMEPGTIFAQGKVLDSSEGCNMANTGKLMKRLKQLLKELKKIKPSNKFKNKMIKITRFKPMVGRGDKLWDEGWRVHMRKFWFIKFLVWEKEI